ncbi:MAG: hypothetical protein KJN99_13295 [Marinicaulis sp.]|nr:hypothetical protein [Marinicaulis sp.]
MSRIVMRRRSRFSPRIVVFTAVIAGFAATGVSADTLAQPKDDSLERTAASYVQYREDVAAIEAMPFNNANVTREAHRRLGAHNPKALSNGWVAYAALVAADTPEFKEAIKDAMKKRKKRGMTGKDQLLSNIAQDPGFIRSMDGADEAVAAVLAMTASDGARITALGETFKAQAYAMQKTKWGKQRIAASQKRISEADAYSKKRATPGAPDLTRSSDGGVIAPSLASAATWGSDWGEQAPAGRMREANAKAVMDRILNLAARYSTDTLNPKIVKVYATDRKSEQCLGMAKLTLNQCIAATRTPYEEAFCLGEHGLNDISTCTGWVGGTGS